MADKKLTYEEAVLAAARNYRKLSDGFNAKYASLLDSVAMADYKIDMQDARDQLMDAVLADG